jgi:hypothetical protein
MRRKKEREKESRDEDKDTERTVNQQCPSLF